MFDFVGLVDGCYWYCCLVGVGGVGLFGLCCVVDFVVVVGDFYVVVFVGNV